MAQSPPEVPHAGQFFRHQAGVQRANWQMPLTTYLGYAPGKAVDARYYGCFSTARWNWTRPSDRRNYKFVVREMPSHEEVL